MTEMLAHGTLQWKPQEDRQGGRGAARVDKIKTTQNRHLRSVASACFFGEPTGNRTQDLRIKSPVLYQLSYRLYWRCI